MGIKEEEIINHLIINLKGYKKNGNKRKLWRFLLGMMRKMRVSKSKEIKCIL
jgi:hypothetical protein